MSVTPKQRQELAVKAGIDEQYLYQCLTGRRDLDPIKAVRLEKLAKGLLSRADVRRDWADVWPGFKPKKAA